MTKKPDPDRTRLTEADAPDTVRFSQARNERVWFENELINLQQHLYALPEQTCDMERARLKLDIAGVLIGLNRLQDAWDTAHALLGRFIAEEQFELAVRACSVLYQADQPLSIAALGQGCWLAVTYPIQPALSIEILHHIVDETPDHSDGAAVAAMAAQYLADLRGGEQREALMFLTTQMIVKVARRYRNIEGEERIKIWIEQLELNDTNLLFSRLAKIIDTITAEHWWFDRQVLRTRLPVN